MCALNDKYSPLKKCPKCHKDTMVVVEIHGGISGSPRRFFAKDKKVQLEILKSNVFTG